MRIYKGSEITLKLYTRINCQSIETDKMRVVLFTTNPNNSYMVNNVVVSGDTLLVTVGRNDLNAMEDGVINYIILGYDDNEEIYNSTRQSNYYLKTPDGYVAKSIQTSKDVYIVDNGDYKILPDEDYSSIEEVNVHVEFDAEPYIQRGIELGEEIQKSKLESVSITENGIYTREDGYNEIHVEVPDLNGDFQTGYDEGIEVGKAEQKALLEPITITENGTYENENGYSTIEVNVPDTNGSYDEGYTDGYAEGEAKGVENAGEIVAANAIDLVATEFGTYYTKYSDNIVNPNPITGVFPNGETFHNLANIKNIIYNTNIYINNNSIIEFWYKGDNENTDDGWNQILNAESISDEKTLALAYTYRNNNELRLSWGHRNYSIVWNDDVFNHLIISPNGVFLNDEKVVDIENMTFTSSVPCVINGIAFDFGRRFANGSFGMIKITTDGIENIIIPTEDGLKNITTDELLEVVYNEGTYEYINNDPIILDNLIKSVNVQPKINVEKVGLKFGYSSFSTIPEWADFSNVTDMYYMFYNCNNLTSIPQIDTSKVISMERMFSNCTNLTTIPQLDTSKVINMSYMFYTCRNLLSIPQLDTSKVTGMSNMFGFCGNLQTIPLIDTSNVTNMSYMFHSCSNLLSIPQIDTSNVTNMSYMFHSCSNLLSIPLLDVSNVTNMGSYFRNGGGSSLTDVGGWIGLKINWNDNYGLVLCPNLTYQSCINILNGLYDFRGNGDETTTKTLKVHPNFLTTVGDEISIGIAKGWVISV